MRYWGQVIGLLVLSCALANVPGVLGQDAASKPIGKAPNQEPAEKEKSDKPIEAPLEARGNQGKPELPFRIQLLDTHIRFEANGDSRKEVHTIVKIINVLGAHQFARLAFDYNRSFQQIEIPMVHISHANGGTSDVLPSAVTDGPNPEVQAFPAYHDVRVKAVRILGLQEGDTIEYRVITTTTKHPLAPDFWLEHTFDRSGQVLHEIYELDVPTPRLRIRINPEARAVMSEKTGEGESARALYRWDINFESSKNSNAPDSTASDIELTTFSSWTRVAKRISLIDTGATTGLFYDIMRAAGASTEPVSAKEIYKVVSQKVATVDLPLELSGYLRREPEEVLRAGYGTPLEKARLLTLAMVQNKGIVESFVMYGGASSFQNELPRPTLLAGALGRIHEGAQRIFLAIDVAEAPFGMIPADLRGRQALIIENFADDSKECFVQIPSELPFPATQRVNVDAAISKDGELKAKVKYTLRGDNELTLRTAFHQAPKEKWKDVANLLAISDGFRGQIVSVNASDPLETKDPFTVEYELTQAKFVDWSKKPVRIPALLPQIGLPDTSPMAVAGQSGTQIELGTPLEVQTTMTLQLPPGTTVETPPGTSVSRDYATFTSKYSSTQNTVTASRHINFLKRELPADRTMDYSAFVRAVQSDQAQRLTLIENGK